MAVSRRGSEIENLIPVLTDKNFAQGELTDFDLDLQNNKIDNKSSFFFFFIPYDWIHSSRVALVNNTPSATVVLLLNNMIGSGILVQAYVFKESGILVVTLEYVIVGIMTYVGIDLLIESADHEQILDYSELAKKALGVYGALAVDASITTGMFGAILSYIMIIGSLCQNILLTYIDAQWCTSSAVWSILLVGIFVLPLSCIRDFGHLAYVSVWSIATIAATIFVVLIVGLLSFKKNEGEKLNLDLFQGSIRMLGTVVFAFSYSPAIFQAYSAIKKEERNIKNFNTIARWTTALGVILSFTFGLMGYISFREDTNVDILQNFSGIIGTIFKLIFVVHLVLYIPGDYVIMRFYYYKLFGGDASTADDCSYITSTFLVLSFATLLSNIIQTYYADSYGLALVLGLTGGVSNSIYGFILPGLIAINVLSHDSTAYKTGYILLVFGCTIPFLVLASIVLQYSGV